MSQPNSSARISQNKNAAALLASQKNEKMASQTVEPMACQKDEQQSVNIKTPQSKGQQSKTVKLKSLKLRVRLNDRSYRVMLLAVDGEPYLCSLRHSEWEAVEDNHTVFLEMVKEKLRARIVKADDNEAAKLKTLLTTIEEKSK